MTLSLLAMSIVVNLALWLRIQHEQDEQRILRRRIAAYEDAIRRNLDRQNLLTVRNTQLERRLHLSSMLVCPGVIVEHEHNAGCVTSLFHPN